MRENIDVLVIFNLDLVLQKRLRFEKYTCLSTCPRFLGAIIAYLMNENLPGHGAHHAANVLLSKRFDIASTGNITYPQIGYDFVHGRCSVYGTLHVEELLER